SMQIGVLGAGRVGTALAERWRAAGHDVVISTRETVAETARGKDAVLLAVPCQAAPAVLAAAGPLDGVVVIDATNNLSGGPDGAALAALVPGARTVKAFNTVFSPFFASPPTPAASLVYCGDDDAAKDLVAELIRDAGFDPVDAGGSEVTEQVEAFARLVIGIAYRQGRGPFVYRFDGAA
ncbi:MAG: NADPH-dependent F420 reductase, partial [Gaiella sp.]